MSLRISVGGAVGRLENGPKRKYIIRVVSHALSKIAIRIAGVVLRNDEDLWRSNMKVIGQQRNSRMCVICGLDNQFGVRAPFYNMTDGSVASPFRYRAWHQSYPGRVHGGMITAMLDEMGLRGLWAAKNDDTEFGVTISLETRYRKPVPYETELLATGKLIEDRSRLFAVEARILTPDGELLADGILRYLHLPVERISESASVHEEMPYSPECTITELQVPD